MNAKNLLGIGLLIFFLTCAIGSGAEVSGPKKTTTPAEEWEIVAGSRSVWTVYVSPAGLKNRAFIAQILHTLVTQHVPNLTNKTSGEAGKICQVMFFDDKRFAPKNMPMTDPQMLHLKARYNQNDFTKFREFVWIKIVNPKASPPGWKEIKDNIRPGYAN
jgi:hypothetical protein